MKTQPITPVDGQLEAWCHMAPFGSFAATRKKPDGSTERVIQVLDLQAFANVAQAFTGEVLLDFEHNSHASSGDTTAAGWINKLDVRGQGAKPEDGLWALIRFTDVGLQAVLNRRLRFLSPVWPLDEANRPQRLLDACLTNKPNFGDALVPVVNKESPAGGGEQLTKGTTEMKELIALYGLPDTATEADILAAAKARDDEFKALQAKVAEMDTAATNKEASDFYEANKAVIKNKDAFIAQFVANKEATLAVFSTFQTAPVTRAPARTPDAASSRVFSNKLEEYNSLSEGKAKTAFLRANAVEINDIRNAKAQQG